MQFNSKVYILCALTSLIFLCIGIGTVLSQSRAQFYYHSGSVPNASKFYIYTEVNEPDLDIYLNLGLQNGGLHYVCARGMWIGFYRSNFESYAGMHLDEADELHCYQMSNRYSSLRVAGLHDNMYASTLSLFSNVSFSGEQELVVNEAANLTMSQFTSIVRTSMDTWELFTGLNFTGASLCFNATYVHHIGGLGLEPGSIRSIKKGC